MAEVVTIGETMGLFTNSTIGPLRHAVSMTVSAVGAESTVAIGLVRLGHSAQWIGRVGADEIGALVLGRLRSEGIDVSAVVTDPDAPTGLMLKEHRTPSVSRVVYYRSGSAGSRLCRDDLDVAGIAQARILHISGITPALSATAFDAVRLAIATAREAGTIVSFDLNYRSALWNPTEAVRAFREIVECSDIVFASEDEAALVASGVTVAELAAGLAELGPGQAVIKRGASGAAALVASVLHEVAAVSVVAIDPVGAGDAFVAGYLTGVLERLPTEGCLALAAKTGAFAVSVPGDWEGLPSRQELDLLDTPSGTVVR